MEEELILKQVEVLLDMHTKKLQSSIAELKDELSRVRAGLAKAEEVRREDPPASSPTAAEQVAQAPVPAQPAAASDKPIDRNGVAPSDVAIDKIFYSGSR